MISTGTVQVDHHQFLFGEADADFTETAAEGSLVAIGSGVVTVSTGISFGPVRVTLAAHGAAPDVVLGDWEVVEEAVIESVNELSVMATDGTTTDLPPVPPGRYRLRVHGRGRDSNWAQEVHDPVEDYHLVVWPADRGDDTVHTLRKTDTAWSSEVSRVPELDTTVVYVRDESGAVVTVGAQSPEAWAVRDRLNEYGGRPLTEALAAIPVSRDVAGLDRELVDRIEESSADQQRAFARWCVRRAFERAQLADVNWIAPILARMDDGEFDEQFAYSARPRIEDDRSISLTVATGLPASFGLVQQHEAGLGYLRALSPAIGPLEGALEAFCSAAKTYGMDYEQLTSAARLDFFGTP